MIKSERMRPALRPRGKNPRWTWWLLVKSGRCRMEVLTVNRAGECTLPAFSGKDEAEMFLLLGKETFEQRWHVRETSAGKLVSLLSGPYACVRSVALDPSPEMVETGTIGLVSVSRKKFVGRVLALVQSRPTPVSGQTCGSPAFGGYAKKMPDLRLANMPNDEGVKTRYELSARFLVRTYTVLGRG